MGTGQITNPGRRQEAERCNRRECHRAPHESQLKGSVIKDPGVGVFAVGRVDLVVIAQESLGQQLKPVLHLVHQDSSALRTSGTSSAGGGDSPPNSRGKRADCPAVPYNK